MITKEELNNIEVDALKRNIPVMQKEGIDFMVEVLKQQNCTRVLEIGTAIGYSAMCLVSNIPNLIVETIELNKERYQEAKTNIEQYDLNDRIVLHHDDALSFDTNQLKTKSFDCLFIDAAKAQYQKFFDKYIECVKKDGIVIVDNLDFHGMIYDIDHIQNRNTKQLVKKIKRFKDWILEHPLYETKYFSVGDGIIVIYRKDTL